MSVGFPETIKLDQWAYFIKCAFGETPFMVGSATKSKRDWHDVDIVLILDDEEYEKLGFEIGTSNECSISDTKWAVMSFAFSEYGRTMTGLPIDFKFQSTSYANKHYPQSEGYNRYFIGGLEWARQQEIYRSIYEPSELSQPEEREGR